MKPTDINWVARNPEVYTARLQWEMEQLREFFPQFQMKFQDSEIWIEGQFMTRSGNIYHVRAYYPQTYPFDRIISCVLDPDIVRYCDQSSPHAAHHFGIHPKCGGIQLCIFGPDEWNPQFSIVTVLQATAVWLHAIEVKMTTGIWVWPEYKS